MHVPARHVAVGREDDVELEQLAVRVGRRAAEVNALAADGVVDDLACVCHEPQLLGIGGMS
jgi:hypothetical protein